MEESIKYLKRKVAETYKKYKNDPENREVKKDIAAFLRSIHVLEKRHYGKIKTVGDVGRIS